MLANSRQIQSIEMRRCSKVRCPDLVCEYYRRPTQCGNCKYVPHEHSFLASVRGYETLPRNNLEAVMNHLANVGPLSVAGKSIIKCRAFLTYLLAGTFQLLGCSRAKFHNLK